MSAILWLATLLTIYSVIDTVVSIMQQCAHVNKMTAGSWCFQSVYEEDLDQVLND